MNLSIEITDSQYKKAIHTKLHLIVNSVIFILFIFFLIIKNKNKIIVTDAGKQLYNNINIQNT